MTFDPDLISRAIVVWPGSGSTPWPSRSEDRLISEFGMHLAIDLFAIVCKLRDEFYASDARDTARDLSEMGSLAAAKFRKLHPELSDDSIQAFAWCYTFDYK